MAFPPPTLPTNRSNSTPQQNTHPGDHNAVNSAVNDIVGRMATIESWTPGSRTPAAPWTGNIQFWVNGNSQLVYLRIDITRPSIDAFAGFVVVPTLPAEAIPTHGYHRFMARIGTTAGPMSGQVNIESGTGEISVVDAVTGLAKISGATFYPKIS